MKTIGLLGGTGWSSTVDYYRILNEMVNQRLGGYHSAKILLKSIDYHYIMTNYGKDHDKVAEALQTELSELIALKPDCIVICCNALHKYYDMIKTKLDSQIPVFHAVDLVAQHIKDQDYKKILLLAAKITMEDGFFAKRLEQDGTAVIVPNQEERIGMQNIHDKLMQNIVDEESKNYFRDMIMRYQDLDAVILGCTEYPLVVDRGNSVLPIINPVYLQASAAVDYALA